MKFFISNTNSNIQTTPPTGGGTMPGITAKLAGYWIAGEDQLATSNLVDSGTAYTMPVSTELQDATELISLNTWFVGATAQTINKTSISNYCAGKQFYGNDTLIILKKDNYLTEAEETALLTHLEITAVHSFHANSNALFARFTNTYSANEKSRLDNVMRWLVNSGIYAITDHLYLALTSKIEEMSLDWMGATNDLTDNGYDVTAAPYKGLAPQTGTYYTGAIPNDDTNISLNDGYLAFKTKMDFDLPSYSNYFGGGGLSAKPFNVTSLYRGYDIRLNNTYPYYFKLPSGIKYSDSVVVTRTASNNTDIYIKGINRHNSTAPSIAVGTSEMKIGGEIANRGNSSNDFIQFLAWGSSLTEVQSVLLNKLIDDFAAHQEYLDTEYVEQEGVKIYVKNQGFLAINGTKVIWQDFDNLYYSEDLGDTIYSQAALPIANIRIDFANIFDNGKIIFTSRENIAYKTTSALTTITEMTPTKNGSTYPLHTPADPSKPGNYYRGLKLGGHNYTIDDGRQICIWPNYCNVLSGKSPALILYSFGDEIKVGFEFGQNPYDTDAGVLLGDAAETILTRHGHVLTQDEGNINTFYLTTGDFDRSALAPVVSDFYESKVLKFDYNSTTDVLTRTLVVEGSAYTKVKMGNIRVFADGSVFYISDATYQTGNEDERGWFTTTLANLANLATHTRIYYQGDGNPITGNSIYRDGLYLGGYGATGIAPGDFNSPGVTFAKTIGALAPLKFDIPGNVFYISSVEYETNKIMLTCLTDYWYNSQYSIILDLTNADRLL